MPALEDHAIVIGIDNYCAPFSKIDGPETDAKAFRDWLIRFAKVDPKNIRHVFSSDFSNAATCSIASRKPALDAIIEQFTELVALTNENALLPLPRVGRRLYLYMAGHGLAPRVGDDADKLEAAALLTANAQPHSPGLHFPGPAYARWFRDSHAFDEVFLFMDCCRNTFDDVEQASVPFSVVKGGRPEKVKTLFVLGTEWDAPAFEQMLGSPAQPRGVFTYALLEVLKSAINQDRRLTSSVLQGNLNAAITELRKGDVPQFPRFKSSNNDDIVILDSNGDAALEAMPHVTIAWDAALHGLTCDILDGFSQPLAPPVTAVCTGHTTLSLRQGLYNVRLSDQREITLRIRVGMAGDRQDVGTVTVR